MNIRTGIPSGSLVRVRLVLSMQLTLGLQARVIQLTWCMQVGQQFALGSIEHRALLDVAPLAAFPAAGGLLHKS